LYFKDKLVAMKNLLVKENIDNITTVPTEFIWIMFWFIEVAWFFLRPQTYWEIAGMIGHIDSPDFSITEGVFVNMLYELRAFCTSVVASSADGSIIHGRMMDFDYAD